MSKVRKVILIILTVLAAGSYFFERWLDQRFGVLRLGQNYSKPNSSPSEKNKEARIQWNVKFE